MAPTNNHVAEMQGLYGPFTIAERVVQKIWLRGDFARDRAVLADGRPLLIRSAGTWNLLGGPDFLGARLVLEGRELTGDIEVHFHVNDWRAHGHAADRAYDRVVLHVVLFPPAEFERAARDARGGEIPTLVLLPLLHRDLEDYASDDALEGITARDHWERFAELAATPEAERRELIRAHAERRWQQKLRTARIRIERLGWQEAAHHTALEILGYRQNRAAMLMIAARYALEAWSNGAEPELLYEAGRGYWQLQGVRPPSHPLARLRQYKRWVVARPDWPDRLAALAPSFEGRWETAASTPEVRRVLGLGRRRETLAGEITADTVGGTRLDNLICDGLLPLASVRTGRDLHAAWHHWFLGDVPAQVRQALPRLGLAGTGGQPHCHGLAQGLLGWILACEAGASP
jgi:hypothetical protein